MNQLIEKIINLSPKQFAKILFKLPMISVYLQAPNIISPKEAFRLIFNDRFDEFDKYRMEFISNHKFFESVNEKFIAKRSKRLIFEAWYELIYVLIRAMKPQTILETGVFDGKSSAIILLALHKNSQGSLVSIDFPATEIVRGSTECMSDTTLPLGCAPGWLIPDYLKDRHRLELGDSKKLLPELLHELKQIDIFLHDSLHTYEHQYFEYGTAWPYLKQHGLLLSDDIFWSSAFHQFCREKKISYLNLFNNIGIVKRNKI